MFFLLTDADKAIQHSTPFSFPWPLGSQFSMMGLSELKAAINLENDGVASSERQRIMKWTIDDVMSHVRTISPDQAKVFGEQVCTTLKNSLILKERHVTSPKSFRQSKHNILSRFPLSQPPNEVDSQTKSFRLSFRIYVSCVL